MCVYIYIYVCIFFAVFLVSCYSTDLEEVDFFMSFPV